jgi:endonuclease/exonuclease/phosphatase family metal-dependent hydrolase
MIEDMQARWPAAFDRISAAHCRGALPVTYAPTWFYGWYGVQSGLVELQSKAIMAFLSDQTHNKADWYREQLVNPPDIGCINDDFAVNNEIEFFKAKNALSAFMVEFIEAADKQLTLKEPFLLNLGIPDVDDIESLKQDHTTPVDQLIKRVAPTLGKVEVRAKGDRKSLSCSDSVRVVVFNAERGRTWKEVCGKLQSHSELSGAHVYILNEMDNGMARTHNEDTTALLADCLGMDYVFGTEFVELSDGLGGKYGGERADAAAFGKLSSRSLHGNAILSAFPLKHFEVLRLGGEEFWHKGGPHDEPRLGGPMALFATLPVVDADGAHSGSVQLVSTHLHFYLGEPYNEVCAKNISKKLEERTNDHARRAIIGGDFGSPGRTSTAANYLVNEMKFQQIGQTHDSPCSLCSGVWMMVRGMPNTTGKHAVSSDGLSDHNFLSLDLQDVCSSR